MKKRTCLKCGWVAFSITRKKAIAEVLRFNKYFDSLSRAEQKSFYGGKSTSIKDYEKCWCGNPHTHFREYKEGDCPPGATLSPVIHEKTG